MKKNNLILLLILISLFIAVGFIVPKKSNSPTNDKAISETPKEQKPTKERQEAEIPINQPSERVTKKDFGIFITSQNSPVQPERFAGYHTGVDYEIFPEELETDVSVQAVCPGEIVLKKWANGYGGVLVQECRLDSETTTVVYGHLDLSSIEKEVGENLIIEEAIGLLGDNESSDTDNERKHLHLSIHRGPTINLAGYVQTESELVNWIDPCLYFCQ